MYVFILFLLLIGFVVFLVGLFLGARFILNKIRSNFSIKKLITGRNDTNE